MSDLSKVLGDLYSGGDEAEPTSTYRATAPEWADESRLDEAFSTWTPGPPPEASAAEREMSAGVIDMPSVPLDRLEDDLAATLSHALVENGEPDVPMAGAPAYALPEMDDVAPLFAPEPEPVEAPVAYTPEPEPEPVAPIGPWTRAHDDILPSTSAGAKLPKAPKVKLPKVKAPKLKAAKPELTDNSAGAGESKKLFGMQLRRK
jgi:hypothetical protein